MVLGGGGSVSFLFSLLFSPRDVFGGVFGPWGGVWGGGGPSTRRPGQRDLVPREFFSYLLWEFQGTLSSYNGRPFDRLCAFFCCRLVRGSRWGVLPRFFRCACYWPNLLKVCYGFCRSPGGICCLSTGWVLDQ